MPDKVFLTREQLSERLKERGLELAPSTLAKYATTGGGPPFQKWGRTPVYDPELADRWAEERLGITRHSTSEADAARHTTEPVAA